MGMIVVDDTRGKRRIASGDFVEERRLYEYNANCVIYDYGLKQFKIVTIINGLVVWRPRSFFFISIQV